MKSFYSSAKKTALQEQKLFVKEYICYCLTQKNNGNAGSEELALPLNHKTPKGFAKSIIALPFGNVKKGMVILNEIIIAGTNVSVKEYKGNRVVTFKDIDAVHGRPKGTAKRNFGKNRQHFIEGEDYFIVKPSDFQMNEFRSSEINNRGTTVLTESGYLMLAKSFTDTLAWDVQRALVKSYFKAKNESAISTVPDVNAPKPNLNDCLAALTVLRFLRETENSINHKDGVKAIDRAIKLCGMSMTILLL